MTNKDDSAYPITEQQSDYSYMQGLTKRELFAAMALQGLVSRMNGSVEDDVYAAVKAADALIEELNKNKGEENDPRNRK